MPEICRPGQRVRIVQRIARREGDWTVEVCGQVLAVDEQPTGSWYAYAKDGKFWLRRVRLRKDDGDITTLTVDQHTDVQVLADC